MNDGYIELIIAIIEQAKKDYKEALKDIDSISQETREKAQKRKRECERFFLGKWGQTLTDGHGRLIMNRCKEEVAQEKKESDLNGREKNVCKDDN